MTESSAKHLIDENEIRAALRPWRPTHDRFSEGVRDRIDVAMKQRSDAHRNDNSNACDSRSSDWLRIAASFAPIPLLGRNLDASIAPISFAAISLGKKLVVVLAFPLLCFLMVGLTLIGMMRIRAVQRGQGSASVDVEQAQQAITQWWKHYGWAAAVVFTFALLAPFLGWAMPFMVALVCSGVAAVSLIRTLAKEDLVDRTVVGGIFVGGLAILGQMSQSLRYLNTSQVLDPNLVTGVLFGGSFMIGALLQPSAWTGQNTKPVLRKRTKLVLLVSFAISNLALAFLAYRVTSYWPLLLIAVEITVAVLLLTTPQFRATMRVPSVVASLFVGLLIMGLCSKSYWGGVTSADLQHFVESHAENQIGRRDDWLDTAMWLKQSGVGYDRELVMERFQRDLNLHPEMRSLMLTAATRSGLISDSELLAYVDVQAERKQLADSSSSSRPLVNMPHEYFRIVALAASNDSTQTESDILIGRLMADWNRIASEDFEFRTLTDVLLISELIDRLDPTTERKRRVADVHRWLAEFQVIESRWFQNVGGFRSYMRTNASDRLATVAAINLMEIYGAPKALDIAMLRSYLRPNALDDLQAYNYAPKVVARQKLDRLADISQPTIIDYLKSELPLWVSIMLVLLLAYATYSSPVRSMNEPESSGC